MSLNNPYIDTTAVDQSNGCNRYRIHTDAVKEFLITPTLSPQEMAYTYASEADILILHTF